MEGPPKIGKAITLRPVHAKIDEYLNTLLKESDEDVLLEMESLAKKNNFPIVGRLAGNFLSILTKSIGAQRIFELGSGFGFSAYWFSLGMDGGELILTDGSESNISMAMEYLSRVQRKCDFKYCTGFAQDVFQETSGEFDIVYNDVDKCDYPEVWELARDRIRPGGYYIADNTLWYGRVTAEKPGYESQPGWTKSIKEHNSLIFEDTDFDAFINPIGDGVLVARRK